MWFSNDKLGRVLYRVLVIEGLRGIAKAGEIVEVRTGFGGGDCGYAFEVGGKYFIDASMQDGAFLTGICFLTAPIQDSEVELRTLRRIASGQRPPDLVGVLRRGTETRDGETFTPLPGVSIEARSVAGRSGLRTTTDGLGSFAFERLPQGKNDLILDLPANLSAAYTSTGILGDGQIPSISIDPKEVDGGACHIRIVVEPSGSISGVVQPSGSGPIDGWVNADTVTPDDRPWNTVRSAIPLPDGKFSLGHLKPGRYSIQFTSKAGFVRGKQQIIELKDGERRTGVLLLTQ